MFLQSAIITTNKFGVFIYAGIISKKSLKRIHNKRQPDRTKNFFLLNFKHMCHHYIFHNWCFLRI